MLDRRAMLGAAACALPGQSWAGSSRVITAMMTDDPATLCYPLFNTRLTQEICGNMNESLLLFDWQFRPQPNLARSFEMSKDGLTYVFHLRDELLVSRDDLIEIIHLIHRSLERRQPIRG